MCVENENNNDRGQPCVYPVMFFSNALLSSQPSGVRGSCKSAHILLNLLNLMRKIEKMLGKPHILLLFHLEFNKFNNTGAQMLDSF